MGAGQSTEKKSPSKEVQEASKPKESPKKEATPSKSVEAEVNNVKTPTKTPEPKSSGDTETVTPVIEVTKVSEEDVAEVEAAAKKMRDTVGGTSIEIVLSPAVKKVSFKSIIHSID